MKEYNLKDSELLSTGVQRLLSKNPHWLILKGNFFISLLLMISLLLLSYYVKFPDFINSKVTISPVAIQNYNKYVTGRLTVSSKDFNKIKVGQKVIVKLYDFPYQEYGVLNAYVHKVSATPGRSHIDITFPKGIETSYHRNISLQKEQKGNAEIVDNNIRLIEKIYRQLIQ